LENKQDGVLDKGKTMDNAQKHNNWNTKVYVPPPPKHINVTWNIIEQLKKLITKLQEPEQFHLYDSDGQ
jgi:hypothetical protein